MIDLRQGDCLEEMETLADSSIDMVLTDPPYGTTACKWDSIIPLEPMWDQLKRVTKPNGAIVMTAGQPFTTTLIASNMEMFKYCWVWNKGKGTGFLNAKKQPLRSCEDVVIFYAGQCIYNPVMRTGFKPYKRTRVKSKTQNYGKQIGTVTVSNGERYPLTLIEFERDSDRFHPTQKPIGLMEYMVKTYTNEGDTVLDFTMGSGTTGVAAKNLNRNFIGIELDDSYFAFAKERLGQ